MSLKTRAFCFTLNNYTSTEYAWLFDPVHLGVVYSYLVCGKEVAPTTGTPHLQGYVYFKHQKTLAAASKFIPRASLRAAGGDAEANYIYCSKDKDFEEVGVRPLSQVQKGKKNIDRYKAAWVCAKVGAVDQIPADILIRHYRTIKEIAKDYMVVPGDCSGTTGVWIYGPSGVGKSRYAREKYPGSYLKCANKWWDGYQSQVSVILDDLDPNHSKLGHHLKIWSDRYSFIAETKHGAVAIRPDSFVVTSQYSIDEIWMDSETRDALRRRFKVIHMSGGITYTHPPHHPDFVPPINSP